MNPVFLLHHVYESSISTERRHILAALPSSVASISSSGATNSGGSSSTIPASAVAGSVDLIDRQQVLQDIFGNVLRVVCYLCYFEKVGVLICKGRCGTFKMMVVL